MKSKMKFRSMSFHAGEINIDLVKLGARLGFNDVQFQTESGTMGPLKDLRKLADENGYFDIAKELGLTTSIWVHELEDYDETWGPIEIDNAKLWDNISDKYRYILSELLPELDYLVLTVVETQINITKSGLLQKLVMKIYEQCCNYGKKLVFRSFVWYPEEENAVIEALGGLPQDVIIMTKCVPQDWQMRSINDPLIGNVGGKTQFVEVDIAGEYFRFDFVANCFTDILEEQFKYWVENGCEGIAVRVRRYDCVFGHRYSDVLDQPQEVNLWALGYLASGKSDNLNKIWMDYAEYTFGNRAAKVMIDVLRPTGNVIAEGLCVGSEAFEDTRDKIPAFNSMSKGALVSDTEDEKNNIYKNPFYTPRSSWRWDKSYIEEYHRMRKGHPEIIHQKSDAYKDALILADRSLELIETVKDILPPGAYEFFKFKLEENKFHLIAMCEIELAWLKASNIIYLCKSNEEKSGIMSQIKSHLDNLELLTNRYSESLDCVWRGKHYTQKRGEYIDIPGFIKEFKRYWNYE